MTLLDEIEACIPALRRYAQALVRNRDTADDLVQDCLERAVAGRAGWRGEGPVRAWLFRILLNRFRDGHRSPDALRHLVVVDNLREPVGSGGQDEHLALREVEEALQRLPPDQRTALLLVALEGLTIEEAAQVLEIPEGTLASRIARARAALREMTGRNGGAPQSRRGVVG
jgi:RNA polymerase sigma-70 factor (ECF subfamily)